MRAAAKFKARCDLKVLSVCSVVVINDPGYRTRKDVDHRMVEVADNITFLKREVFLEETLIGHSVCHVRCSLGMR